MAFGLKTFVDPTGLLSKAFGGKAWYESSGGGGGEHFDPASWKQTGAGKTFDPSRVSGMYQQILGRAPDQNELEQFKKYLEDGDLQYQDVAEILGGMPEAQGNRLRANYSDLEGRLGQSDSAILGRGLEQLEGEYRRLGRADSSGLASSFARSAGDLALNRQQALNNFYAGGLNNLSNAYMARSEGARARGYDLENRRYDFNANLDMARLGNAYQQQGEGRQLATQKAMASGQLFGTLAGAGLGLAASGGNPLGAYVGGQLGSGLGANYGLMRR